MAADLKTNYAYECFTSRSGTSAKTRKHRALLVKARRRSGDLPTPNEIFKKYGVYGERGGHFESDRARLARENREAR